MVRESDISYLAGLFDGEGSVYYKQLKQKRHQRPGKPIHNVWSIRMEIAMTDESIIRWVHDFLGVGSCGPRKVKPGKKKQWRWRCSHRDAYFVARLLWPYAHVKLEKINQIINHYGDHKVMNGNIVNLEEYKKAMGLE
jgi:hypothetical protein|tara:strand:- start:240 stop:653 length:414 start_codon:yes stop_codon:yes gene_type:complete